MVDRKKRGKRVIPKSGPSSNSLSLRDDDAGAPQSLFVVLYYDGPRYIRILQLNTQVSIQGAHSTPEPVDQKAYIARFNVPRECPLISWFFSPPTSSTEDLYMVPNLEGHEDIGPPLSGYKFNFRDRRTCQPIMPPRASKFFPNVVNRSGHIYLMSHPDYYYETPDPVFECYDPDKKVWKALEPFPVRHAYLLRGYIYATAVWDDTILYCMGRCQLWAYNVTKDRWYEVIVEDDRCNSIEGEAVVLGNMIYALTYLSRDSVLALSIKREEINDDPVYTCSFCSQLLLPGMGQTAFEVEGGGCKWQLVHLGEDDFCLVQSFIFQDSRRKQPIQLTCLKLTREKSLTVTNICVYEVENQHGENFEVKLCFSRPEGKTTALKEEEGEGKEQEFSLDPEDYMHQNERTKLISTLKLPVGVSRTWHKFYVSLIVHLIFVTMLVFFRVPVQENENVALHKDEGHSIIVRNFSLDTPFWQIAARLTEFGSIKTDGIRVRRDKMDTGCAVVDFESVGSKQRAIKGRSVLINECSASIEEY